MSTDFPEWYQDELNKKTNIAMSYPTRKEDHFKPVSGEIMEVLNKTAERLRSDKPTSLEKLNINEIKNEIIKIMDGAKAKRQNLNYPNEGWIEANAVISTCEHLLKFLFNLNRKD